MTRQGKPAVAVILPAYLSSQTIAGCLRAIQAQTYQPFRAMVVDSSPDNSVADLVEAEFPEVQLVRSPVRLLPHQARNVGVGACEEPLVSFTDPDIYPAPNWLDELWAVHERHGGVVVGSMLAFNQDWAGRGIHLSKFDIWLPGGPIRPMALAMTGSMLVSRERLKELGGLVGDELLGDMLLSWRAAQAGVPITFAPAAVVYHDHRSSLAGFLAERWVRGQAFARLRMGHLGWGRGKCLTHLAITWLPFRLVHLVWRVAYNARRANRLAEFLLTCPWVLAGQSAWLAGEGKIYLQTALGQFDT